MTTVTHALRAAAAACGLHTFSSYSLRRSRAVHGFLAGADAKVLRQLLRHSSRGQVYRRYIDPLLAAFDLHGAQRHYLDPKIPDLEPIALGDVAVHPQLQRPRPLAFLGGPIEELLDGIDLADLRVPYRLANLASSTIDAGRHAYRRFAVWANEHGVDPAGPGDYDLVEWALDRLDAGPKPSSIAGELASVRIGWVDATGADEIPGYDDAAQLLAGAVREAATRSTGADESSRSREATDADALVMLPEAVAPGQRWAKAVLLACAASRGSHVEILSVEQSSTTVRINQSEPVKMRRAAGMHDPVAAAALLLEAEVRQVAGTATWRDVTAAATPVTQTLQRRLLVTLIHASGARSSDLARARRAGVDAQPGGFAIWLAARKGQRPNRNRVNPELLWCPQRDDELDPVAALEAWDAWWPYDTGPLLPKLNATAVTGGVLRPYTSATVGNQLRKMIADAALEDLTPRGFRYALAGREHRAGTPLEAIAELLGHEDTRTTQGYCLNFDPFLDGVDDQAVLVAVAEEAS